MKKKYTQKQLDRIQKGLTFEIQALDTGNILMFAHETFSDAAERVRYQIKHWGEILEDAGYWEKEGVG